MLTTKATSNEDTHITAPFSMRSRRDSSPVESDEGTQYDDEPERDDVVDEVHKDAQESEIQTSGIHDAGAKYNDKSSPKEVQAQEFNLFKSAVNAKFRLQDQILQQMRAQLHEQGETNQFFRAQRSEFIKTNDDMRRKTNQQEQHHRRNGEMILRLEVAIQSMEASVRSLGERLAGERSQREVVRKSLKKDVEELKRENIKLRMRVMTLELDRNKGP
ncbi:hypothetical protein PT974_04522 [Cladobotryum mycophilum]|uniref:Uncharacterized protein n=1 Tax=Cladobotryum mycophilum TaxID=491253 RepID=A0ABR0SWE9_9HYPO